MDALGLPASLAGLMLQKHGLILVVGATGSGKSTSLAAMIDHRNASMSGHIMNRLRDEKVMEGYGQYVEKLKKEAKIEKF